jgi:hypothetical protein
LSVRKLQWSAQVQGRPTPSLYLSLAEQTLANVDWVIVEDPTTRYDRQLLLMGEKRNAVLELSEIKRYGTDSYGDADYVSIYGMRPSDWYASGVRLLGRTAVECTRDGLAAAVGKDIAHIAQTAPPVGGTLVIDPFAGSGNTLYWMLRYLPGARGLGFELDDAVFECTKRNLATLALPMEIVNADYRSGLAGVTIPDDHLLVAFIAPPWGNALNSVSGLDLRRTTPPITEVVDFLGQTFGSNLMLCAIQVYEIIDPLSLAELKPKFDWSSLRIYDLNVSGEKHGVLLGTLGWAP